MDRYQKLLCEKAKKKRDLLGKAFLPQRPLLLIDLSETENPEGFDDLLQGLDAIGMVTFVVAENVSQNAARSHNEHLYYLLPEKKAAVFNAADIVVVFDNNLGEIWKRGAVPIAKADSAQTLDYNPLKEKGNGFYFKNPTKWEIFAAIIRALETYQFPYDWENLIREILRYSQNERL